jgi:hypothetical protein
MYNNHTNITKRSKDMFIRLFTFLPETLESFKHYENDKSEKGLRYKYLIFIFNQGLNEYYKTIDDNTPDFYDETEPSFLVDFEYPLELHEWVLSGMNKKNQNEFFNSIEDDCDSP